MGAGCMSHVEVLICMCMYYHVSGRVASSQAPVVNSFVSKVALHIPQRSCGSP